MNKSWFVTSSFFAISTLCAITNSSKSPCMCLEQGLGLDAAPNCYTAAYNAPAAITLKNGWDFNLFASFIYWHISQESMEVAAIDPISTSFASVDHSLAFPSFEYKPGFKAGFGFDTNYDDWTGWVEYTWLHQSTHHTNITSAENRFVSLWITGSDVHTTDIHSKWKMHLDMLDAALSRPYYEGTQLTISPYAGMRGLWIRQNFNMSFVNDSGIAYLLKNQSHSWAVGPMIGTTGHWLLGLGFRFEGEAGASLLYTQYTRLRNLESNTTNFVSRSFHDYNVLRPTADLGVGLGWGSYFNDQKYYWDLSARYDFNIFWDQNVMTRFSNSLRGIVGTSGNLYLHGFTLFSRFDF